MDVVNDGVDVAHDFLSNNTENDFFDEVEEKHCRLIGTFTTHLECSIIDLDVFLLGIIDVSAITREERERVELTTRQPVQNRSIDALNASSCYHNARF